MKISAASSSQLPPPLWVQTRWWSVTHWLIAVNVVVYVVDVLSQGLLTYVGAFSAGRALVHFQLWRLITYNFLHASPTHLIFNMISLWAFGPSVELILRPRRYLAFYLLSGLGGVAGYLLLWRLRFLDVTDQTTLVGASACIFGVLVAAATMAPHRIIRLIWPPVELRFRTLASILIGLAVLVIAAHRGNAGGEAAHLGGAVVGYVLIRNMHWFSAVWIAPRRQKFWKPGDPASNFFRPDA